MYSLFERTVKTQLLTYFQLKIVTGGKPPEHIFYVNNCPDKHTEIREALITTKQHL